MVGCVETNPDPSILNIENVSIAGFSVKNLDEEVSLFLSLKNIPKRNKWKMVWKINGSQIHIEPIPKTVTSLVSFHRYIPQSTGKFVYEGCISNGDIEVCQGSHFSVIE